jgi:paraquat-inducible protein B
MTTLPPPHVSRAPSLPLIWVVPLVALLVGGWLIYREWRTRGPVITIQFSEGAGITAGRTILQHKGVPVGRVRAVDLSPDLRHVLVQVQLERSAAEIARAASAFWIVQPQFSLSGIEGLDTLLSGPRLAVRPGPGDVRHEFIGLSRPPPPANVDAGRAFLLETDRLNGLGTGTTVTFRDIPVGTVEESRLAPDSRRVLLRIRIQSPYDDLVRPNTRFWSSGGLSLRVGLRGAQINASSLSSLLSGSISFATPDSDAALPPAGEGMRFVLHGEADNDWLKWNPVLPIAAEPIAPYREIGVD